MNRTSFHCDARKALLLLALLSLFAKAQGQIAPGTPAKEYIRLADRLIAIEHISQPGSLPSGLASTPINSACSLNGAEFSNGLFTVAGTGVGGLGGTVDSFEFASVPVTGDVTIIARIPDNLAGALSTNAAVGLMLRTDLTASSPYALMGVGRHSIYQPLLPLFRTRATTGAPPASSYAPVSVAFIPPYWFKLERSGNTITGSMSNNGVDWTQLGTPLTGITAPTIYAGLAVGNSTANCTTATILTAAMDNVVISTGPDFYLTTSPATVSSSGAGETNTFSVGVNPVQAFSSPVSFTVEGLPSGASWMFTPATVTPAASTILTVTTPPDTPAGSYPFTIHSAGGGKAHISYATFTVATSADGGLASGWRTINIHSAAPCSFDTAAYANGAFTVSSVGGLNAAKDDFEFAYAPVTGDFTLIGRIPVPMSGYPLLSSGGAGLMIRTGLTVYDEYALIGVGRPTNYVAHFQTVFRTRASAGAVPASSYGSSFLYGSFYGPYWFKLVRSGNSISGYTSINGVDWVALGAPFTGITSSTLYAGLAVASGQSACNPSYLSTATFDNLALFGGTGGGTPDFSIGVPSGVPSVSAGGNLNMTTTVAATGGFSEQVEFSVSDLPDGSDGLFDPPATGGQGTSNLMISTSSSLTMPGSYSPTITGDSSSLSRSAIATFTVDPPATEPPTALVSPASGGGASQTFSLTATEPTGAGNVRWLQFLVNDALSSQWACYVHYDVASNELYLRDDADPSWAGSKQLGTAGSLANGQCTVDIGASSFSAPGGTTATLNLAVTFKAAFAGDKTTYGLVDSGNWNSGWEALGFWTVPVPPGALPGGWTAEAVNNGCALNTAAFDAGVYSMTGAGGGLGVGTATDSFLFPSIPITGDVTIVGRIATGLSGFLNHLSNGGVGLMLRKGPTSASSYAFMGVGRAGYGPVQEMFRGRETDAGQSATPVFGPNFTAPYWFKLVRSGDTITGYSSSDGAAWTSRGTIDITGATAIYAGLAVIQGGGASCSPTYSLSTTFDNVSITSP